LGHTAVGWDRAGQAGQGSHLALDPSSGWVQAKIKRYPVRSEICGSRESPMKLKDVLTYAAIAFLIWWVVQQPANAAHLIHNIAGLLTNAAKGLSNFVANI
jgi:hypothetical protein